MTPLKATLTAATLTLAIGGTLAGCVTHATDPYSNGPAVVDDPRCDQTVQDAGHDPYAGCCAGAQVITVQPDTPHNRSREAATCADLDRDDKILQSYIQSH